MPCAIANFLLVSATAGITHMSQMWLSYLSPLFGLSEYALIICCFHPLSPGQETDTKVWWGQNQSWAQKWHNQRREEWKPLLQLQDFWVIPSIRLVNLHLWNIWIDNECSHNWSCSRFNNCGHWGQIHTNWVCCSVLGQSLSLLHSAHSRSKKTVLKDWRGRQRVSSWLT